MEEDHLDEDPVINSQQWACISIITPSSIKDPEGNIIPQEHNVRAFKIRGVYGTEEAARKRCEDIRKFDKYHNVFIGMVGRWLPWDDDVSKVDEAVYAEKKLNDMMKAYKDSQEKARDYADERKMKAHADAKKKKMEVEAENQKEKELNNKNVVISNEEIVQDEEKIKTLVENLAVEEKKLLNENNIVQLKESTVTEIDEELTKAKILYEDLMSKYNLEKDQLEKDAKEQLNSV